MVGWNELCNPDVDNVVFSKGYDFTPLACIMFKMLDLDVDIDAVNINNVVDNEVRIIRCEVQIHG